MRKASYVRTCEKIDSWPCAERLGGVRGDKQGSLFNRFDDMVSHRNDDGSLGYWRVLELEQLFSEIPCVLVDRTGQPYSVPVLFGSDKGLEFG